MFPYKELVHLLDLDIRAEGVTGQEPITSDLSIRQIRCLQLSRSFLKKLCPTSVPDQRLVKASTRAFIENNERLPDPDIPFRYPAENDLDALFWDYFRSNLNKALDRSEDFDLNFIAQTMSTGPGAALGADARTFYTKVFLSPLTATSEYLIALYRAAILDSELWCEAERQRTGSFGVRIVQGNRLFFVPKNVEELRTCCTEASVNMLLQKAYGAYLERCLKEAFNITLDKQPDNNRYLAYKGSVDGSFGTIDLSKASDSISWALCKTALDPRHCRWLKLFRAEETTLPGGSSIPLRMVSTMGNGFTFPLQTLMFASVVRSVYQLMDLPSSDPAAHFGVFGDDIIVVKDAYHFVVRCLTKLGFRVNESKSFNDGSFRESCGSDWYSGHSVRGVYITSLETTSDLYSAINRLNKWSAHSGVPLRRVVTFLRDRLVDNKTLLFVPPSEGDDVGVKVPFDLTSPKVDDNYWFSYKKLASKSRRLKVPSTVEESIVFGYKDFNPCGLAITFLGGFARTSFPPITERYLTDVMSDIPKSRPAYMGVREVGGRSRRKVVRTSIPYWDWEGPEVPKTALARLSWYLSYGVWKDSVAYNLSFC
jgi:hypothetical protein